MVDFTGKVMSREGGKQLSEDDAPYRIKSRDYTVSSGEHCAIQSKPNLTVATAGITAFEASPRVAPGIAAIKLVGFSSNPILKSEVGKGGGNVGVMRCFEGKLETGVHCTRTTAVMAVLEAMSDVRGTVSQGPTVILVNKGAYKVWESVMELKGNEAGVWNSDPGTEISGSVTGYIKVIVNGVARYIGLYPTGPTD